MAFVFCQRLPRINKHFGATTTMLRQLQKVSALLLLTSVTEANASGIECKRNGTQLQMNFCAADDKKAADSKLHELLEDQMSRLTSPDNRANLKKSQEAWEVYREAACFYETGPREKSGSIWPMEHDNCFAKHAQDRIVELQRYLDCTQGGCPQ